MYTPQTPYAQIALNSITRELGIHIPDSKLNFHSIPQEFYHLRKGCFVSLHLKSGDLRGCIGTIYPQEKNLFEEISRNALSAAFHDNRFTPLTVSEIDEVEISVDVLTQPEIIHSINDLDPQIYGVIVSDDDYHRAVLLPGIHGIDTIEQQLNIVRRKAGICKCKDWEELKIERFSSTRYR